MASLRVASTYVYEPSDSMQLIKVTTKLGDLLTTEILRPRDGNGKDPREWRRRDNCLGAASWLLAFYDSLLYWEEKSGSAFVEILTPGNKASIGKCFSLLQLDVRVEALSRCHAAVPNTTPAPSLPISGDAMQFFSGPFRSKRLAAGGLLAAALRKQKVSVGDMELAIITDQGDGEGRHAKRARTSKTTME